MLLVRDLAWTCFLTILCLQQFRAQDVVTLMDQEETSGSDDSEDELRLGRLSRGSINGLQVALAEGWIVNRGREVSGFESPPIQGSITDYLNSSWSLSFMTDTVKLPLTLVLTKCPGMFKWCLWRFQICCWRLRNPIISKWPNTFSSQLQSLALLASYKLNSFCLYLDVSHYW